MSPGRGRRAALPQAGFQLQPRLCEERQALVVHHIREDHGAGSKDYDFSALPISRALQEAFARAFATRTRPGGGLRAGGSADGAFHRLVSFATYLGGLQRPPEQAGDLVPAHVDGWYLQRAVSAWRPRELGELKVTLKKVSGISSEFLAKVSERGHRRQSTTTVSYSREEFDRILNAARHDIRRAARRIRDSRALLARWRAGEIDAQDQQRYRHGQVLDMVDRDADVPRYASKKKQQVKEWVRAVGSVPDLVTALHLSPGEAVAFVVLLIGLTGENKGTIVNAPAMHHRPDGYAGPVGTVIVELDKPRRGPRRHMDVALVEVPDWVPVPQDNPDPDELDLRTPFGVYLLLHELAAASRRILGVDRLLVWWAASGGSGKATGRPAGRGLRTGLNSDVVMRWAEERRLRFDRSSPQAPDDTDTPERLDTNALRGKETANLRRLRLTHTELHQRPVAHTEPTLANDYLLRNRGNITEYQQIVAKVMEEQVGQAKTRAALRTLTVEEVEQARTDPRAFAARHGLDAATLKRMVDGQLDTVMAACGDHVNSDFSRPGQPCQASFHALPRLP